MREITTKVYTFDELPEATQDKIIKKWDNADYDWWERVYEDSERVGVTIQEFDIDRRTISIKCNYPIDTARKLLEEHGETCDTYILAKSFLDKINPLVEKLERIEDRECLRVTQGNLEDEGEDTWPLFHALGEEYLSILRQEYEWLTSVEGIIETIKANEYEFTKQGEMV